MTVSPLQRATEKRTQALAKVRDMVLAGPVTWGTNAPTPFENAVKAYGAACAKAAMEQADADRKAAER